MSTITIKGQVTIPKSIRNALDIGPGSRVEFVTNRDSQVILRKFDDTTPDSDRLDKVRGRLGPNMSTDNIMALLRSDD